MMRCIRLTRLLAVLVLFVISINAFGTDSVTLPIPTGSYTVGRTLIYINTDREELWTEEEEDSRELPLLIWYPSNDSSGPLADYLPYGQEANSERFEAIREWSSKLMIHSLQDASIASTPSTFPIIIFSPGGGTGPWGYHMILEDLASHGFIVISIDHTYQGAGQVLRNGTFIQPAPGATFSPKSEQGSPEFEVELEDWYMGISDNRSDDIRSVILALKDLDQETESLLHNQLDLRRIGVLGHSIGGIAAAHAVAEVDEIQSGVNIDGHFDSLTFDPARMPSKPFMAIEAEGPAPSDELLEHEGYTREEYNRAMRDIANQQAATYRQINQGAYRVYIDGANHSTVHDRALINAQGEGGDSEDIVQAARIYLLAFFEKTLLGITDTALDNMPEELYSFTSVEAF